MTLFFMPPTVVADTVRTFNRCADEEDKAHFHAYLPCAGHIGEGPP